MLTHGPPFYALRLGSAYSEQPSSNFAYAGRTARFAGSIMVNEIPGGPPRVGPANADGLEETDITSADVPA
jgi:hypothetical protein